ncbi:MAG: hypothetical protein LBT46_06950, partial [Planctomycetaceae bacterium]|nr:hypothetical protein [Planctomycetaceae bacterium]
MTKSRDGRVLPLSPRTMKKFFTAAVFSFPPFSIIAPFCIIAGVAAGSAFCQGPPPQQQQIDPPTSFFGVLFAPRTSQPRCLRKQQTQAEPSDCQAAISRVPNGEAAPVTGQQRIVYVPYACPPPIYGERGQRGGMLRGLMPQGQDAYLQAYPEMPPQGVMPQGMSQQGMTQQGVMSQGGMQQGGAPPIYGERGQRGGM